MKAKIVPISLITALALLYLLPFLNQFLSWHPPIPRAGSLIYSLIFLCLWGVFLWYSIKRKSKGLVRLYQLFWLLMTLLRPFIFVQMFFGVILRIPFVETLIRVPLLLEPPLGGLWMFGMPESSTFFGLPLLMFILGIVAKRKFMK